MDIIAHGLWTNVVFHPHTKRLAKRLFGIKNSSSKGDGPNRKSSFGKGVGKEHRKEKLQRLVAVLFGILPDLVSFVPVTLFVLVSHQNFSSRLLASNFWVFHYAAASYDFTHSIIIFLVVMVIVTVIRGIFSANVSDGDNLSFVKKSDLLFNIKFWLKRGIYWPMWGWALHILIDIPTHKNFYETPFLFPLSSYKFGNGIRWANPSFMILNYGALILIYLFWFLRIKKRKNVNVLAPSSGGEKVLPKK